MPIRINLLAEAQALEELRRRDPVKRVILLGIVAAMLIFAYSSSLLVKTIIAKGDVNRLEQSIDSKKGAYSQILLNQQTLIETRQKLEALHRLSTNRFLHGNLLNSLQETTNANVQLLQMKVSQSYVLIEETKRKNRTDRTPTQPARATERITLTLNAKDSSLSPGDAVNAFQRSLSEAPFFRGLLSKTGEFRLTALGAPQMDPEGKSFVVFTMEARFPEKVR